MKREMIIQQIQDRLRESYTLAVKAYDLTSEIPGPQAKDDYNLELAIYEVVDCIRARIGDCQIEIERGSK